MFKQAEFMELGLLSVASSDDEGCNEVLKRTAALMTRAPSPPTIMCLIYSHRPAPLANTHTQTLAHTLLPTDSNDSMTLFTSNCTLIIPRVLFPGTAKRKRAVREQPSLRIRKQQAHALTE